MNSQSSLANDPDRPGWFALFLPLVAFGFASILPIPLSGVGWGSAAQFSSTVGVMALPASVLLAMVVAFRSWRDRPSRRNRALGGLLLGLLLSTFFVLALIEVNRKTAALQQHLEEAARKSGPP